MATRRTRKAAVKKRLEARKTARAKKLTPVTGSTRITRKRPVPARVAAPQGQATSPAGAPKPVKLIKAPVEVFTGGREGPSAQPKGITDIGRLQDLFDKRERARQAIAEGREPDPADLITAQQGSAVDRAIALAQGAIKRLPEGAPDLEIGEQVGRVGREPIPIQLPTSPLGREAFARATNVEDIIKELGGRVNIPDDPDTTEEEKAARRAQNAELLARAEEIAQIRQTQETERAQRQAAGTAAGAAVSQEDALGNTAQGIEDAALSQIMASLPEGMEGLGTAVQNALNAQDQSIAAQFGLRNQSMALAEGVFNRKNDIFGAASQRAADIFNSTAQMLENSRERQSKLLAQQQDNFNKQSIFEQGKLERDQRRLLTKQIDQLTASLALRGGFGSTSGLAEISEAEFRGEQALIDMQKEFGFERADVSMQFTALQNQAEDNFQQKWLTSLQNYGNRLDILDLQFAANEDAMSKSVLDAATKFADEVGEARRGKAKMILDFATDVNKMNMEMLQEQRKGIIKTKDSLEFAQNIRKEITANKFISEARQVDTRFRSIESALAFVEEAEKSGDVTQKNFADQAMINLFNKITDPTSVVRESEFARSAAGLSMMQRFEALYRRVQEGGVLEPDARRELRDAASVIAKEYKSQLARDIQPYIIDVDTFNSQPGVETPIRLDQILPRNLIPVLPTATIDQWKMQAGGEDVSFGSSLPDGSFGTGKFRTDRHNNPTAFTIDIARQAGLVEGVDYEVGDPFPKNPNLKTARIIGDPIAQTIKVIDKIGFYTGKGHQRWTHTAMSRSDWNSLTLEQKAGVVVEMSKKEGSDGSFLANSSIAPQDDMFIASTQVTPKKREEIQQEVDKVKTGEKTQQDVINDPRFSAEDVRLFAQMMGIQAIRFPGEIFHGGAEAVADILQFAGRNIANPFIRGVAQAFSP